MTKLYLVLGLVSLLLCTACGSSNGSVTGFIPKIKQYSTWEGPGADHTNMEAIGVTPDGNSLFGGDSGLLMVVKFVRNK